MKHDRAETLSLITLVGILFSFSSLHAAEKLTKLPPELVAMQTKYSKVKTLTTLFTQKQKSVALGTTRESSGRIFIKRPNLFRWQTESPEPSLLVSNGKKVWYYTPPSDPNDKSAKGRVMVKRAADVQSKLAVDLLSGQGELLKSFAITELAPLHYGLKPLKPSGDIDRLELQLERSTNLVYKLILFSTIGNQTELELKSTELSPKLPDSMFTFAVPENTEEIR